MAVLSEAAEAFQADAALEASREDSARGEAEVFRAGGARSAVAVGAAHSEARSAEATERPEYTCGR